MANKTNKSKSKRKFNKASLSVRIGIYEFLKNSLERTDDGKWRYRNGLDDHAVARTIANLHKEEIIHSHVGSVRREMFGPLRNETTKTQVKKLQARIIELEQQVTALEAELAKY